MFWRAGCSSIFSFVHLFLRLAWVQGLFPSFSFRKSYPNVQTSRLRFWKSTPLCMCSVVPWGERRDRSVFWRCKHEDLLWLCCCAMFHSIFNMKWYRWAMAAAKDASLCQECITHDEPGGSVATQVAGADRTCFYRMNLDLPVWPAGSNSSRVPVSDRRFDLVI